jgi:hypothetical protein
MTSELAKQTAASAWCKPLTSHIPMDIALAEAFAEILEEVWSKPWLGNATTGQLLDEIKARVNCNYKTVGGEECEEPKSPSPRPN